MDRKGKPQKLSDPDVNSIVSSVQSGQVDMTPEDMVDRLMIPMCIEAARCLEDHIVGAAFEVDMGLVYGIGFPPFRGGALHHVDKIGLEAFCARADQFADLGPLYHPTDNMRKMASSGRTFYTKRGTDASGDNGNGTDTNGSNTSDSNASSTVGNTTNTAGSNRHSADKNSTDQSDTDSGATA
jgi:3-hydroxyacyl-CoA dehydrogenase